MRSLLILVPLLASTAWAQAQPRANRIVVPLSDPTRPAVLEVSLLAGGITVTGWDGKEVVIVPGGDGAEPGKREYWEEDRDQDDRSRGLRRIPNLASGLEIEEADNLVSISSSNHRDVELTIQVPRASSINLSTVNDGDIVVHDVTGEITVQNTNGDVRLTGIPGPAVVHALNGEILVKFARLDAKKGSSFSSLNGDIDVTLAADARAELSIKTDNGEIYTDFDLQLGPRTTELDGDDSKTSRKGKKRRYGYETSMAGSLNGGGPTIRFQTFNGSIYIRKAK